MSVVSFPGPPTPAAGPPPASPLTAPLTTAVERFLGSVQAASTRTGYAETLARLTGHDEHPNEKSR
ncbi:hypothetical protein [Nonomuraea sp. CA-141351]|uniref:hypothetical protein n=1 Tax=Nonomuraea sp. CA-141351 TaxID=3239996 RepID=UPI003D8D0231